MWANLDPYGGNIGYIDGQHTPSAFGQPFHFALTFEESTGKIRFYENGILKQTLVTTLRLNNLNDINNWLGRSNYSTGSNLQGRINEFRIYNRALDAAAIAADSAAGPNVDPVLDSDGDGIPDVIEIADPDLNEHDPADGSGDFDSDGLTNAQEYALGTDLRNADTDGDGMPDGYEVANGLNPLNADDQLGDPDGDRVPNIYDVCQWNGGGKWQ